MRLLLGGLFDFKIGCALVHFAFELIACLLEFSQALANPARELREFFRPEKQDYDHKDEEGLGPTGHTESDW
jgi:hypothetical protein